MRRVRQESRQDRAAGGRLRFAMLFSAVLHAALIYGLAPRPGGSRESAPVAIHARLMPSEVEPVRRRPVRLQPVPASVPRSLAPSQAIPLPDAAAPAPRDASVSDSRPAIADAVIELPALPHASDLVHYPAKDLDLYPQLQAALQPIYPQAAREQAIAGAVTLLVLIDEAGRVTGVSVVDAAPEGVFESSAQQALAGAAFIPAQRDGRKVRSRILVNVDYDPDKP